MQSITNALASDLNVCGTVMVGMSCENHAHHWSIMQEAWFALGYYVSIMTVNKYSNSVLTFHCIYHCMTSQGKLLYK
jgi:hypothetical protein